MNQRKQDTNTEDGWRVMGELMLPAGSADNNPIETWLERTLQPLELNPNLVNRVRLSALQAVERVTHSDDETKIVHIHLRIFITSTPAVKEKTWGFFRMEKNDVLGENLIPKHNIDLHLYLEG